MENEVTDFGTCAAQRVGRRAALGAGAGGVALSLLPFLSGRAAATTPPDSTNDSVNDSTTVATTAPPQRPTNDDLAVLGEAQVLELTARALYDEAIAAGGWSDEQAVVMVYIREAHEAYAQSLAGLIGRTAPGVRSEKLFTSLKAGFGGSVDGALAAAYALESAAVATHADVLSLLVGIDGAALIASIQMNEARFCTVLADLSGVTDEADLLVDSEADSLVGKG